MSVNNFSNTIYWTDGKVAAQTGASAWSVSVWFYHITRDTNAQVFQAFNAGNNDVFHMFYLNSASVYRTRIDVSVGGDLICNIAEADVAADTWHNYILTYDGSELAVYLNGANAGDSPIAGGTAVMMDYGAMRIGNNTSLSTPWQGSIAEWAQYSKVLSAGERAMLQVLPPIRVARASLVQYDPLYDNSAKDKSGSGNDGSWTGTPTFGNNPPLAPPYGYDIGLPYVVAAGGLSIPIAIHHLRQAGGL